MSATDKSPEEIEREVEQVRAEVRTTLGDIRESLSPGQMLDHGLEYVRHSGGADFSRNLGRSIRDNPLPVALIGAGIGWLLVADRTGMGARRRPRYTAAELYTDPDTHHVHVDGDDRRRGYGSRAADAASGAGHRTGDAAHSARDRADSMASSAKESMSSMTENAKEGMSSMSRSAREGASSASQSAREGMSSMGESARRMAHDARDRVGDYASTASEYASHAGETMRHAGERVRDYGYGARRSAVRMAEEQPLVLGALGFAVGAVLGALLPTSRTEQRLFGSTADRFKEQAKEMAREGMSEAASRASEAVHAAGEGVKSTIDPKRREGNGGTGKQQEAGATNRGSATSHH
jgi:hypothetical protein